MLISSVNAKKIVKEKYQYNCAEFNVLLGNIQLT